MGYLFDIEDPNPPADTPTWGDYGKAATKGVHDLSGAANAAGRLLSEWNNDPEGAKYYETGQKLNRLDSEDAVAGMSDAGRKRIEAGITSEKFWQHPISSMALKATGALPSIAAGIAPAVFLPGVVAGTAGVALAGGALGAAQTAEDIDKAVDKATDEQLSGVPLYAGYRSMMDEQSARDAFREDIRGNKLLLNFAIGAVTNATGAMGQGARVIAGSRGALTAGAERGTLGRVGVGGAEAGGSSMVQAGVQNASVQNALMEGGLQQDFDVRQWLDSVGEAGAMAAPMGMALGLPGGKRTAAKGERPVVEETVAPEKIGTPAKPEVVEVGAPDAAQTAALAAKNAQATPEPKPEVTPPAVFTPPVIRDPRTADNAAVPPEVAAAAKRVAAPERTPEVAPEVARAPVESIPERVPPEVIDAADRVNNAPEPAPRIEKVTSEVTPEPVVEAAKRVAAEEPGPKETKVEPTVEAPPIVPAVVEAVAPPVKTGRVLRAQDATEKKAVAEAKRVSKELDAKRLAETTQADKRVANLAEDKPVAASHKSKAEVAERTRQATEAKTIFEKHVPEELTLPTKAADKATLRAWVDAAVREALDAGIKIPTKTYATTADHVVWLREAQALAKSFGGKRGPTAAQLESFMGRTRAAKGGDFSVMRAERKVEGDLAKRRDQGSVEERAAVAAGPDLEKNQVATVVSKIAKGAVRDAKSEEKAASSVRKVEITDELRKKYETPKAEIAATKSLAKKVATAAKDVEPNPTEAQKKAGNYEKGHVTVHGMDITLENARGTQRSGVGPDGKPWSVTMPGHYGYVKGTKGADGDHVDVYIGKKPESQRAYVIDQVDAKTKKFDEHKVMLGYETHVDAVEAYKRAFSDGKGAERIGAVTELPVEHFKAWVEKGFTKEPLGDVKSHDDAITAHAMEREPVGLDPQVPIAHSKTSLGLALKHVRGLEGEQLDLNAAKGRVLHSTNLRDALNSVDLSHFDGTLAEKLSPFVKRRLIELVGDTPVHVLGEGDLASLMRPYVGEGRSSNVDGAWVPHPGQDYIVMRAEMLKNQKRTAHVVIHEAVHAATSRVLHDPVKGATLDRSIVRMMAELEAHDATNALHYGMTNTHEFIAEALSNPKFQDVLARTPVSEKLAASLGLDRLRPFSMWQALVSEIRRALGIPPDAHTMLDTALRVSELTFGVKRDEMIGNGSFKPERASPLHPMEGARALERDTQSIVDRVLRRPEMQDQASRPWLLKLRTMDQIAQAAESYFRGNNPVRVIADKLEMIRVSAEKLLQKSEPVVTKLYELENKYKGTEHWENFTSLVHDETMAGVFADRDLAGNSHLGKDALAGMWGKSQHARLAQRFRELPEDLKAARIEAMKYFTDQQNAMSLAIIKNRVLKTLGIEDDALAQRIHENHTTEADMKLLGPETLKLITEAKELSKIEGPYFPLMRRGDYVVRGNYKVEAPTKGDFRKLAPNEFEFKGKDARDRAIEYAQSQDHKPSIKSVWTDAAGEQNHTNPDGSTTRVSKNDADAEQRFRVLIQDRHVEFFHTDKEARAAAAELEKSPSMAHVEGVEARRFEPGDRQSDMLSSQMQTLLKSLERREGYKSMTPAQKNELVQSLNEASIRFLGSTRIQSRRLPRRYVAGASKDLTRNTLDYAQSASGYLAKLEHQPDLDTAMKAMREGVTSDDHKGNSLGRSEIANEVERRVAKSTAFEATGKFNEVTKRLMTASFLDKLFSPAHSIINSLQPAMVTMPVLAGKHGVGRAFTALGQAYNDISGLTVLGQGVKNTARKVREAGAETTNFIQDIKSRLKSADERKMLDYLAERGSIDPEAGLEVAALIKSRDGLPAKLDMGLGYLEGIARQMPKALEAINRTATALAAYRLERARGADHESASRYAQETVNNTQFLYSHTNAPPVFNHPLAKLVLQFRKYSQGMYHLLGQQVGRVWRNEKPGDRAEALKTLAGIMATHSAMAGVLGLPTEPIKLLLMGAQAAGLTSFGYDDVENKVRQGTSNFFGKGAGEIISKGLPRAIGVDLSSRVGLDSLVAFGEPKQNTEDSVWAWIGKSVAGAPPALVGDWIKGANQLGSGNFVKAAELMIPVKVVADSIRAYRQATEGKKNRGGSETSAPYSAREAITRSIGFTPAREAEEGARAGAYRRQTQSAKDARSELTNAWVNAKPNEKRAALTAVQTYNKGKPKDEQISMKDLTSAVKRRENEDLDSGLRSNKRDAGSLKRVNDAYNYQ